MIDLVDVAALTRWLDAQGLSPGPVEHLALFARGRRLGYV